MRNARALAVVAVTVFLGLLAAPPVLAAMWVRISLDPAKPLVGAPVRITVLTFSLTQSLCWDDPRVSPIPIARWYSGGPDPDSLDLHLLATGPDSAALRVPLLQRVDDGAYWDGSIVFPSPGEWTLRVGFRLEAPQPPHLAAGARCTGFQRTVTVRPAGDDPAPSVAEPSSDTAISLAPTQSAPQAHGLAWVGVVAVIVALLALLALIAGARSAWPNRPRTNVQSPR